MKIGWIGAGIMGTPMIAHLLDHGHDVHVYARHPDKIKDMIRNRIQLVSSIEELAQDCECICTMVGTPKDVEEVYASIFSHLRPGQITIDFTTSSPELAASLSKKGQAKQTIVFDAPVTGGDVGAKQGTLTILVGGPEEHFEKVKPLFSCFGKSIFYCGPAGSGQKVKIANQIMIANTLQGICEALSYAKSQGVSPQMIIDNLQEGAAGSRQLSLLGEKMVKHAYEPGFYVQHLAKDLRIALSQDQVELPGAQQVYQEYQKLIEEGLGNKGTQALIEAFK